LNRFFGLYVSREMTLLCLVELCLSFTVIYMMLIPTPGADPADLVSQVAGVGFAAMVAVTIGLAAITIGLYRPQICLQWRRQLINALLAGSLAFPAVLVLSETLDITLDHNFMMWLLKVMLAWAAILLITRYAFGVALRLNLFVRRVVVLGGGQRAARMAELIRQERSGFFELASAPPMLADAAGAPAGLFERLRHGDVWGVVVAADAAGTVSVAELLACKLHGIRVYDDVSFWEHHLGRIELEHLDPERMLFAEGFTSGFIESSIRRLFDILISAVLLVLALPLMIVAAIAIKLDSGGPVFYCQERVGLHGRPFTLFKFRSMRVDAEAGGRPRWASQKDPRVTRVGAVIRLARIDELPQLLNVLRGEMSFIGPRPERPHFVAQLEQIIPYYRERASVKPGITGWAQVNYPYGASVEDARAKLSYDLYYVKNRSLILDLLILISTVRVILFQEGAR
jgi:sugar transferase (PEP-CTERM system associated)